MAKIEHILIVGGGIAGLTAAIALRQRGFSPELIEREPAWQAVGAGIALQPNAMRSLIRLRVGTAVERAGAPLRRFKYCTPQGEILAEIDLVELWKGVGPVSAWNAPNSRKRSSVNSKGRDAGSAHGSRR